MLTFVESISLAGDRTKQNDDACGFSGARAWMIDGATDLHDAPLTGCASDAAWLAHVANAQLHAAAAGAMQESVRAAAHAARDAFIERAGSIPAARWQSPIASLLIAEEAAKGLIGVELGDCSIFALDAAGVAKTKGGGDDSGQGEAKAAAQQTDAHKPLLQREDTLRRLRAAREQLNRPGARWTFGIDPACADHARAWALTLTRPAHILLMTDGFAALTDRYGAYDAASLMSAALAKGLQELGRELRAIEHADSAAAKHPRFKRSDDATALLLRLT